MTAPAANPFPGLDPFGRGNPLFGRDRELRELTNQLIGDRLVLLFSPSGAGKTSLIHAGGGIAERMAALGFLVRPTMRVNREPPAGLAADGLNRFTLSALRSQEDQAAEGGEGRPPLTPEELAGLSLAAYVDRALPEDDERDLLLVFDQFEEIVTVASDARDLRRAFFAQLGELLGRRGIFALISMREDFVGELLPDFARLPTGMRSTFRLPLLQREQAIDAIRRPPAELREVTLTLPLAEWIADEVRGAHRADIPPEDRSGLAVEPSQLQLVCWRLWEQQPRAAGDTIDESAIPQIGSIDRVLTTHYDVTLSGIAGNIAGSRLERQIREWVERNLITARGRRGQIVLGDAATDDLDNAYIRQLEKARLVRVERRRKEDWVELSHDLLVAPILASNRVWRGSHLVQLQLEAERWEAEGRPAGRVLREADLAAAETWAAANPDRVTKAEEDFLEHSRKAREDEARERRARDAALGVALAARARRQLRLGASAQVAALLAVEAHALVREAGGTAVDQVDEALREIMGEPFPRRDLLSPGGALLVVALSPDGRTVAAGGEGGRVYLWNLLDLSLAPQTFERRPAANIVALAFDPSGERLALGGDDGGVYLRDLAGGRRLWDAAGHPRAPVTGLFAFEGGLVSAGRDGQLLLWRGDAATPIKLAHLLHPINALAPRPGEREAFTGSEDGAVTLWRIDEPDRPRRRFTLGEPVTALASSPGGRWVAVGVRSRRVFLIDMAGADDSVGELRGYGSPLVGLGFATDGSALYSADGEGLVRGWQFAAPIDRLGVDGLRRAPPAHADLRRPGAAAPLLSLDISRNTAALARAQYVSCWDLGPSPGLPRELPFGRPVRWLGFGAGGRALTIAGPDLTVVAHAGPDFAAAPPLDVTAFDWAPVALVPAMGAFAETLAVAQAGTVTVTAVRHPGGRALVVHDLAAPHLREVALPAEGPPLDLALSPDGRYAAARIEERRLLLVDLASLGARVVQGLADAHGGTRLVRLDDVGAIAGELVVSGGVILVARPEEAGGTQTLSDADTVVRVVCWSRDGAWLAAAGDDPAVRLWDLGGAASGQPPAVRMLRGPEAAPLALAISPEGDALAAGCADGTLWIWRLGQAAQSPLLIRAHPGPVQAVALGEGGRTAVTGDAAGAVRLWVGDTARLAELARAWAARSLSPAEWRRYVGENIPYPQR